MTAPPRPDLAAVKETLRYAIERGPGTLGGAFSPQACLALIEALEAENAKLRAPLIGEALVEAATRAWLEASSMAECDPLDVAGCPFDACECRKEMLAVLAIVVPAVRDAARLAINEAIITEVNDPRNASQPTDFRDGLRVARILVNRALGESGGE